ncbi:MAG: cyclase family protein [Anaerolineae bacterium]|nr:MAG: cyclase family protein [Anaerolineae bacterium]
MTIYDISLPISPELPVWPGDAPIVIEQVEAMDAGAPANVSRLSAGAHIGTHVDAPHHFLNDGRTVESLPLDVLTGPAYVVHFPDDLDDITAAALEAASIPTGTSRLLFRTRNSALWARRVPDFRKDYVAVTADGAEWLVAHGVRLVGADYLSVAPFRDPGPTHRILLGAGVVVIEGVNLWDVPEGEYELYCLPLKLIGCEGAPARAILIS